MDNAFSLFERYGGLLNPEDQLLTLSRHVPSKADATGRVYTDPRRNPIGEIVSFIAEQPRIIFATLSFGDR